MKTRKLSELIRELKEIKDKHGDLPLCHSSDDEGNSYHEVLFSPTPMNMKKTKHNLEFISDMHKPNYICIN
jgi:hypothetical protein